MDEGGLTTAATLSRFIADHLDEVVATWRELVRRDPALPSDSSPAVASAVVTAVARALARPQPPGWGADPEVEKVVEVFATASGSVEVAVSHLVSLREVLRRTLAAAGLPDGEGGADLDARLTMVIDRAIGHAAVVTTARLRDRALSDPRTGLPNRRALERDLAREVSRAERYGRGLTVGVLQSRAAALEPGAAEAVAGAFRGTIRAGDTVYADGDRFVVLLPEADDEVVPALVGRLTSETIEFCWGSAAFPEDGRDPEVLLLLAEERCARTATHPG